MGRREQQYQTARSERTSQVNITETSDTVKNTTGTLRTCVWMTDASRNPDPENDTTVRINNPQTANNLKDIYFFSFIQNANLLLFIFAIYQNATIWKRNLPNQQVLSVDFCQLFNNLSGTCIIKGCTWKRRFTGSSKELRVANFTNPPDLGPLLPRVARWTQESGRPLYAKE